MTKHIQQTYQVLDEIDHIRKRTGMYAGSVTEQKSVEWIYDANTKKMVKREISYIPALVKIFSEILDNAIDESRRAPDTLDSIRVTFEDDGSISVQDNGRGIPVEIHQQTGKYIAETVFSNLRAGSNFNDEEDQQLIGTNGVGSTLTNVLSTHFRIESCDGKKLFRQDFWKGMRERDDPIIKEDTKNRTKISFTPDFEFFKLTGLTEGNRLRMMKKVVDAAACNLGVKFYLNGDRIAVKDFDDYIALYADEYVTDSTPDWKVGISASDGFEQISFINSVETYQGGSHVDYVMIQITDKVRDFIKRKHKLEVKPAEIRGHMRVYISANVNRPKFSSQTKENMISSVKDYKTSWEVPDKMITKILKSNIVQSILDWAAAKAAQEEMKELRKMNKDAAKNDPKRVEKFSDAIEKRDRYKCELYLAEGDSARKSIQEVRGKNPYIGSYALRGKLLNVTDCKTEDILGNNEIANLLTVIGLKIGEKVKSVNELRFGKIVAMTDQDLDGHHISSLLFNFFAKFWPELFELGVIYKLTTPLIIAKTKTEEIEFMDDADYEAWSKKAPKHTFERFKGLGTFTSKEFGKVMSKRESYLTKVEKLEDKDFKAINLAFSGDEADARKEWLSEASYFHEYD